MTAQRDLIIPRGKTYVLTVRWETEPWLYAAIASISHGRARRSAGSTQHGSY